jgi:hypothetical protein
MDFRMSFQRTGKMFDQLTTERTKAKGAAA